MQGIHFTDCDHCIYDVTKTHGFILNYSDNIDGIIFQYLLQKPFDVTSTQDSLLIRFHSDDTLVNKGFSLIYEAIYNDGFSEEEEI